MSQDVFLYEGYEIPVQMIWQTGGGPDTFHSISENHMHVIQTLIPLRPDMSIVEIGCGIGRDAIPLTKILSDKGTYLGIDIQKASIDWDISNINARHPNFRFHHFDIKEEWFNKSGILTLQDCKVPAANNSVDLFILQSVFTHMMPDDIDYYLGEFRRCLKEDGRIYATFFVVDEILLARKNDSLWISFPYDLGGGCYVHDIAHPTQIVAFEYKTLERLASVRGLQVLPLVRGSWSGLSVNPLGGQDNIIFHHANSL